jgi:hypothetical protein
MAWPKVITLSVGYCSLIKLSLGVSTVETNRDRDRDFSTRRDSVKNQDKSRLQGINLSRCRFLNCRDFWTVEMSFFELSRPKVLINTMSRQIKTSRPRLNINIQLKLFNGISLGCKETGNINRMITNVLSVIT